MSISTMTVQTLTGPSVLLKELVQKYRAECQDPDDIVFVDETTLQTTMYSGSGSSLLYLGDALAVKYPTLEIQSTEWFDCFEGVSLAHWKGGRRIYLCEMTEIVSCEVPGGLNWPIPDNRIRFWHDVPDLPLAIQHVFPRYDLMSLMDCPTLAGRWRALHNSYDNVLFRLPSDPEQKDGIFVQMTPQTGRVAIVRGIDRYGCCASEQLVAYADVTARWPELRPLLRTYWRTGKTQRRRNRRWWQLQRKKASRHKNGRSAFLTEKAMGEDEVHEIPF